MTHTRSRPQRWKRIALRTAACVCLAVAAPLSVAAQQSRTTFLDFTVGSEYEDYLRVMQLAGIVPIQPWSIRPLPRPELRRLIEADSTGPWNLRARHANRRLTLGPVTGLTVLNTGFPYGSNDGPLWAGRGITGAISGGLAAAVGPLSLTIAPMAFTAMNQDFPLMPNGQSGAGAFADGEWPDRIDRPQRFGDEPYSRFHPGASELRLDTRFIGAGLSTANEWIGPATEYPFLLGNNAPGFLHAFAGTGRPLPILIGHLHGRVMWGVLQQSDYSSVTGSDRYFSVAEPGRLRIATSLALVYMPRWLPGLELGFSRFQHLPYPREGVPPSYLTKPLRFHLLAEELDRPAIDNQLASAFFRWVFPRAGFELYGERGHEDWFTDTRELLQESDYYRSYSLGFQKILGSRRTTERLNVLRAELVNYQMPTTGRRRSNTYMIYLHSTFRQGHTHHGQLLGTNAGAGVGAAAHVAWTRYTARGRTTARWERTVRGQNGSFHLTGVRDYDATDVIHALGFERTRFFNRFDWNVSLDAMQNLNRHYTNDVFNLNVRTGISLRLH